MACEDEAKQIRKQIEEICEMNERRKYNMNNTMFEDREKLMKEAAENRNKNAHELAKEGAQIAVDEAK